MYSMSLYFLTCVTVGTYKVELNESIEICKHIESIYKDIEYGESVDFLTTIKEVMETLNSIHFYSSSPSSNSTPSSVFLDFDVLHELFVHLKEYHTLLEQLKLNGRLERYITSNRLRRKLDEFNYQLHSKLMNVRSKISSSTSQKSTPNNHIHSSNQEHTLETLEATMKSLSMQYATDDKSSLPPPLPPIPKDATSPSNYESLNAIPNPSIEDNKVEVIVDVEGKNFWEKYFRLYVLLLSSVFILRTIG